MPRPKPHPLTLFSLVPLNERAYEVLQHRNNGHLVSFLEDARNRFAPPLQGINIGFHISSKSQYTLATFGRGNAADIVLEGNSFSRIQCSFEVDETTQEIMLQDRSSNNSTQLLGETAIPFEIGRPRRRVLIKRDCNRVFGFGGTKCDLVQFEIQWNDYGHLDFTKELDTRENHPIFARTVDDTPTEPPTRYATRIHTPKGLLPLRYSIQGELGEGMFGKVYKVTDVDLGRKLALKRVRLPSAISEPAVNLYREIKILSRLSHVSYLAPVYALSLTTSAPYCGVRSLPTRW